MITAFLKQDHHCTHTRDHISLQLNSRVDTEQQHQVYISEVDTSLFTSDTYTQCVFNVVPNNAETETKKPIGEIPQNNTGIHFYSKHAYGDTIGDAHVQYHDFDNGDAFTYKDRYTALLQQELQSPYWSLHDPLTNKIYQISTEMDIETMPHVMYFSGNNSHQINCIPYHRVCYDDKGMFPAKLMDDTPIQVFIDNGATPSILLISTYNTQHCKNIQRPREIHPHRRWYN